MTSSRAVISPNAIEQREKFGFLQLRRWIHNNFCKNVRRIHFNVKGVVTYLRGGYSPTIG